MQRMSLKAYAVKHKMSLFQVIKAVRNGTLPSQTVEENGKEVTYVLVDEDASTEPVEDAKTNEPSDDLQAQITALQSEVKLLRREIEALKRQLGGGVVL